MRVLYPDFRCTLSWLPMVVLVLVMLAPGVRAAESASPVVTNSLGMRLHAIPAGSFMMGEVDKTPTDIFEQADYLQRGDWDEHPVHRVTLTRAFHMAETEVTLEQYQVFRPDFAGNEADAPYVSGVSWDDAVAFCAWLSKREGRLYRLPTEAEWEYACRAGTTTLFSSGDQPPAAGTSNPWGLRNMHSEVVEWCLDWHDTYPIDAQTDPVGPRDGFARVVRGGGLDRRTAFYARSANRAGIAPNFPPFAPAPRKPVSEGNGGEHTQPSAAGQERQAGYTSEFSYQNFIRESHGNEGRHHIGFRVVLAAPAPAATEPGREVFALQGVRQGGPPASIGPDPARPYFRKRFLLPTPPENTADSDLRVHRSLGLHRSFLRHHHSPGLVVAGNGDVLAVFFSASSETDPDVALAITRLRFGTEAWDFPDMFLDFPDVDDTSPMLWNDQGRLWSFWGLNKLESGYPFQWRVSDDHGATWSPVRFPNFTTPIGGYSAQPITSAFRDADGTIHVASDAIGPESVLWKSNDNGETWSDPVGRSGGRHTAFVPLGDGRILGMGGKSSDIDGFMPRSISSDGGETWTISRTAFPALASNQRPTLIRLASGRLLLASDYQTSKGDQPAGVAERGSFVALSDDEGESWQVRKLPGTQPHEDAERAELMRSDTVGYTVVRQAPNGVIHLITTMNEPCLHLAFNEAWIRNGGVEDWSESELMRSRATRVRDARIYRDYDEQGRLRQVYRGGVADDGRFLLDGRVTWYRSDGSLQREAHYELGRLTGLETVRRHDGTVEVQREHRDDGRVIQTTFWPSGAVHTRSGWRALHADGPATVFSPAGEAVYHVEFAAGRVVAESGDPGEY